MALFSAMFNSLTFDFILRQKMASGNINKFILYQVAALHPLAFNKRIRFENNECTARELTIQQMVLLQFDTKSMKPFFESLGFNTPIIWNVEKRMKAFSIIDALIAKLYCIDRNHYAYILSRFEILSKQEEKIFGKFLTRELCLDHFDKIEVI